MAHEVNDEMVMLAELEVKPERLAAFMACTIANLPVCRAYPGNLRFDVLVEVDRPTMVWFHEVWTSADAQRAYMARRAQAGDVAMPTSFLAVPPRFIALRQAGSDPV